MDNPERPEATYLVFGVTWNDRMLGYAGTNVLAEAVEKNVTRLMKSFALDYLRENPEKVRPPSSR
jgi:hypothetical protein